MFLPGIAAMLLMPLVIYFLSPPEIKSTPNAKIFAKGKLEELGAMKGGEKIMLGFLSRFYFYGLELWANLLLLWDLGKFLL
ncbi:C4-dicarboxylate ABC transporter [Campylobacter coli]|nr:C4-dicarboxylate ABC transporter [Campylobacter coli]